MALIALRDYLADRVGQPGATASAGGATLGTQGAPPAPIPRPTLTPSPGGVDPRTLANISRASLLGRGGAFAANLGGADQVGAVLGGAASGANLIRNILDSNRPAATRALGGVGDVLSLTGNLTRLDAVRSLAPSLTSSLTAPLFRVGGGFPVDAGVGAGLGPGFEAAGLSEGVGVSPLGAAGSALSVAKAIYDFSQGDDVGGAMSLISAVPVFAPFVAAANISHGLASDAPKTIQRAIKKAKEAQGTLSTIVETLRGVKSEDSLLAAIRKPLPELADTATLGMVLKTFGEQNLAGEYAHLGWDPNPKLRAAVAYLESLGVPSMPASDINKEGGPPPNPFYPSVPAFQELFSQTAVPYGVKGVKLNERDARQTWDPIIGALADLAIRVDPRFETMGPEPISRERLNERYVLGQVGSIARPDGRGDIAGMPRSSPEDVAMQKRTLIDYLEGALRSPSLAPEERFLRYGTYGDVLGPEHLQQRVREYYQTVTGQPFQPGAPIPAETLARSVPAGASGADEPDRPPALVPGSEDWALRELMGAAG